MGDHYAAGTYRWWHLSQPSPELVSALQDGWLPSSGRALDIGCGLGTEAGHLAAQGWQAGGLAPAPGALAPRAARPPPALSRVLRPGGKLLLRATLRPAGVRNDIDETVIRDTFTGWRIDHLRQTAIPSDTRTLEALVVRLVIA